MLAAAAWFAAPGCNFLDEVPDEASVYRLESNETALMQIYDARLHRWPVPYESLDLETSYGTTRVIASGPAEGQPLVLLHAMGLNATMWLPNVEALAVNHRVYALDTIGDLGKSRLYDHEHYPRDGGEMAGWLTEVMDGLGVESAVLVGSSMGGWIALNAAVHAPGRVDGLALLGPVGIKSPLKVLYRLFRFMLFPTESGKRSMVAWTLGDDPEVRAEFEQYMMTALDCRGKLPMPRTLSDDDLRSVTVPVLLLLGEDDNPVPDPEGLRAKAERLIAGIEVGILADTGHIMNVEEPGSVNRRILEFLGETAPAPAQVPGG
ncbi:MAG: alpha/beta fold hydrolase [bacterium]|jgi:pimeloyl-ACP methyl ester carboxylesterase